MFGHIVCHCWIIFLWFFIFHPWCIWWRDQYVCRFVVFWSHSNIKSCIPLIKSVSCLSATASCVVSCSVFWSCCSNSLKSISDLCSFALAFLPSQSSLDQSDGVLEGCGASYFIVWPPFKSSSAKSFGGWLMSILLKSVELLSCLLHLFCFYRVKTMSSVKPSSSGLSWGMFTFGLGRSGRVRCGIVIIPCHCLSVFILKILNFPMQGGIMVLLHGENTMDLAVWSFLYA